MLNKNTNLIIGKTNTGKTRGVLFREIKRVINNNENLFVLDNRGEYYKTFGESLKEKGYNVYVINFDNPSYSNGYNPLILPYNLYNNGNKDNAFNCIQNITNELFKEEYINNSSDPFWNDTSSSYVSGLILLLLKNASLDEINFGSIGALLNQSSIEYQDTTLLKAYLNKLNVLDSIYLATSSTEFAPFETRGSILSVVRQKLNTILMREDLLNMVSTNELDLNKIDNKTAIFVIGNNIVSNILFEQLVTVIKLKKLQFNLILDNFDAYSRFSSIKEVVENASYYNVKVNVAIKDIDEMKAKYGEYLFNHFENIINTPLPNVELYELGTYDSYPVIKTQESSYFDLEKYMKENE